MSRLHFCQIQALSRDSFFVLASREFPDEPDRWWSGVYAFDGTRWSIIGEFPGIGLTRICVLDAGHLLVGHLLAGSAKGVLLVYARDSGWRSIPLNVNWVPSGVMAFEVGEYYVVGARGHFARVRDTGIEQSESGVKRQLWGLWGSASRDLTIVGEKGTCVRRIDGLVFAEETGVDATFTSIVGDKWGRRFILGLRGIALRNDSGTWRKIVTGVDWGITALSSCEDGSAFCAGHGLLRVVGESASLEFDTDRFSAAVYGAAAVENGQHIVVGTDQTVLIGPPWRSFEPAFAL